MRTLAALLLLSGSLASPPDAAAQRRDPDQRAAAHTRGRGDRIPDQFIVVFRPEVAERASVAHAAHQMASEQGGEVLHVYEDALHGFAVRMPAARAARLKRDPRVKYVEQDAIMRAVATQPNATWGLDRVDQRDLPLDGTYTYVTGASNVHAYIVDTGIRLDHQEFSGRMGNGFDAVTSGGNANDCNGHGTHVAGTVGGTTYGLAKNVTLHPVRVLSCSGSGSTSGVIAGVDWVANNHVKPAVANMSLGGSASQALDDAVSNAIAKGVTFAVAAGNDNANACNYSPARTPNAITVGATTSTDARSSFSNYGSCLDIFAPGSSITSAWHTSSTATNTISGTSMASPHVAGGAALYLADNPGAAPSQVADALNSAATLNKVTNPGSGSPNRLLYTLFGGGSPGDTTPPTASLTAPANGSTVSGTVTVSANASDNVGVSRVEFRANGTNIGSDTTAPYAISWNTTAVANGTYNLTAVAFDAAGNSGTSATVTVTVSNTGGCTTTSQILVNPGFESGATGWAATPYVIDNSGGARTGSWKAWLNGYGFDHTDILYQQVTIPSNACKAILSFWLRISSAETTSYYAYDTLTLTVQNSSGSTLATLARWSNLNETTSYVQKSFDLTAYKGQTIRIHFRGVEDWYYYTSFLVDDTALTITR